MSEDPSYNNGLIVASSTAHWNLFPSSAYPSISIAPVSRPSARITMLTPRVTNALFNTQMDSEFVVRHRSLTTGASRLSAISHGHVGENGTEIIKDEHTYDHRQVHRRHTLATPTAFTNGALSNHSSLSYALPSFYYQPQPRYTSTHVTSPNGGLGPGIHVPTLSPSLPTSTSSQLHPSLLNGSNGLVSSNVATQPAWDGNVRVPMGSLFTQPETVVPWNTSNSSWIQAPHSQNIPENRHPSLLEPHRQYISSSSVPVPFSCPPAETSRILSSGTYNDTSPRTNIDSAPSSGVIRNQRPFMSVRKRSSSVSERPTGLETVVRSSTGVGRRGTATLNAIKRKPLPKIYGCETCDKKFDRPSTLKVHEAIHTGAKDYECEYCIRAFTVQSNMKRHMRVCKHKPLAPPFTLYEFICPIPSPVQPHLLPSSSGTISGSVSPFRTVSSQPVYRPSTVAFSNFTMTAGLPSTDIDRTSNVPLDSHQMSHAPVMQIPARGSMVSVDYQFPSHPHQPAFHSPPLKVRGYKAPMIIAAMFSVNQKVPNSIAKFTLVHLECEIPLMPVKPHTKYAGWYNPGGDTGVVPGAEAITEVQDHSADMYLNFDVDSTTPHNISPASLATRPNPHPPSSSSDSSNPSAGPSKHPSSKPNKDAKVEDAESDRGKLEIDGSMRTKNLQPLPLDRLEERNSYYPRTRHCYHPAEYDAIAILPGPGIMELPLDRDDGSSSV